MSSNVAIAIENRKTGAQLNKDVPVNGRSDKFAAITGQNSIQATHVWVQKPATAQGIQIGIATSDGRTLSVKSDGTPTDVSSGGNPVDIAQWTIGAAKV